MQVKGSGPAVDRSCGTLDKPRLTLKGAWSGPSGDNTSCDKDPDSLLTTVSTMAQFRTTPSASKPDGAGSFP